MVDFNDIYKSNNGVDKVYTKLNELFNINIEAQLKGLDYHFETLHQIIDLVNQTIYYSLTIDGTDLNFQDRTGLFELLIRYTERQISNIPQELEALENERHNARYRDDVQHFYETEALSEKEGKLTKLKNKLQKDYNKLTVNKRDKPSK